MLPMINKSSTIAREDFQIDINEFPESCGISHSFGAGRTPRGLLVVVESDNTRLLIVSITLQFAIIKTTTASSVAPICYFYQQFCKGCSSVIINSILSDITHAHPWTEKFILEGSEQGDSSISYAPVYTQYTTLSCYHPHHRHSRIPHFSHSNSFPPTITTNISSSSVPESLSKVS